MNSSSLLVLAVLTLSTSASAQQIAPSPTPGSTGITGNLTLINQDRFLGVGSSKRFMQSNITLKGSVDLNGIIQIHTLVQSGNGYNVGFNNIYDIHSEQFNSLDSATKLYLKRLYLKRSMMGGDLTVSAGAIDTRSSIAQTNGLSSNGWIDGTRAELKTKIGSMTMTAGQINTTTANAIDRFKNPNFNYFEITLSRKIFDKMLFEGGVEVFEGKTFIESATKYDIEIAANKVIKMAGDAKVETNNGAFKVGANVQDILSLFTNKISDVKLAVGYEYVSSNFQSDMNKMANTMHTGYTGGALITGLQYPISKKYGINGFTNVRIGNESSDFRMETGVVKTIFNKSYKRKNKN